jgi:hypothetical protein
MMKRNTAKMAAVVAYPSRAAGAKPGLFETGNGGNTWEKLTAPPVPWPADNNQPAAPFRIMLSIFRT